MYSVWSVLPANLGSTRLTIPPTTLGSSPSCDQVMTLEKGAEEGESTTAL
jgi:hypothetical protein